MFYAKKKNDQKRCWEARDKISQFYGFLGFLSYYDCPTAVKCVQIWANALSIGMQKSVIETLRVKQVGVSDSSLSALLAITSLVSHTLNRQTIWRNNSIHSISEFPPHLSLALLPRSAFRCEFFVIAATVMLRFNVSSLIELIFSV